MAVSPSQVKELRERTGAGMMDCKRALEEADGDLARAAEILRDRGQATAAKKAARHAGEGVVASYIHPGGRVGSLIEVNCETDFVARTEAFLDLAHNLAMQVAALSPRWVRREDVPADVVERERSHFAREAEQEGKPAPIVERIAAGRLDRFYREVCLVEQAYVKDPDHTVADLIQEHVARLGENIQVRRFARFERGEDAE